jgi:PAS domain S-box-containing protein
MTVTDYRDPGLSDTASLAVDLLRTLAERWRFRVEAGRLGGHQLDEAVHLVAALESSLAALGSTPPVPLPISQGEHRFRLLVDSVRDYAIFMLTPEGLVASWNDGAERIKGYRAEEIVGSHFSVFYPKEDLDAGKPQRELDIATREGRFAEEGWRVRKSGERFWASISLTALRDTEGRLTGFAKVTRDVTDLREASEALRQSEERLRLMIDVVRDYAIFMLDQTGHVVSWNVGAERLKGYRASDILGKHFSIFYSDDDRRRAHPEEELRRAKAEGRYEEEGWRVRKDGSRFWANVVITAVFDQEGRHLGFTKVTRDFTEAKRLRDAQLAVQLRDEFLSIAGHELRTPLSALLLQVQSVARNARIDDPKTRQRLDKAAAAGLRLEQLISQMLDVSRITAGRLELHPESIRLDQVAAEVVDRFADVAAESSCAVTLRLEPVSGVWDRLRIEQVISNLVTNAFKYGKGRPVEVETRAEGDHAILRIIDHGIGIDAADQRRIFERFERARGTREYGGFGLGLWIARNLVEANDGKIEVDSELGKGATFTVTLRKESDGAQ